MKRLEYSNNLSSLCRNGFLRGGGGLNFITEQKRKFSFFSCIEVIDVTVVALLIHRSTVLNSIDIS